MDGGLAFDVSGTGATVEVGDGGVDADAGLAGAEYAAVICGAGDADHLDQGIQGELFGGAGVVDDRVGAGLLGGVDEALARRGGVR